MYKEKICVIGLGYVGLPIAVEFGRKYPTTGYDNNPERIKELKNGIDRTNELAFDEIQSSSNIKFTSEIKDVKDCSVFIVTVPTPINENKEPDLSYLQSACQDIGKILPKDALVIFESTVYPGCTEEFCVPILEKYSGLKLNEDFYCGYSPERIVPGDKIYTLKNITKITSGSNEYASERVDKLYKSIIDAGTFMASSIKTAEAAKVIENCQRDLNIAFVNELSKIFEILDLDTNEIIDAAATKWNFIKYNPGIVGGHCISVDPYYLTYKSIKEGYYPQIITAGREINDSMSEYFATRIINLMSENSIDVEHSKILILGFTFKENCPDIRNTKVIDIYNFLRNKGAEVLVSDTCADVEEVKKEYGLEINNISEQSKFDAVIIAVGHKEYRQFKPSDLNKFFDTSTKIIGDLKALYNKQNFKENGYKIISL